jgi:hypothetical protein
MTTNQLINYANAKGMNIATATNEFGELRVGIEWKSNCVYYWFKESCDGDLMFIERYSQRTGSSKTTFTMTQVNIRESVESFNA